MRYPDARRDDLVDELHGHRVPDPYRWLEDPAGPGVEAWSAAQDALVAEVLGAVPWRAALRHRLADLVPEVTGPPVVAGDRWFFTSRRAGDDHAVVCTGPEAAARAGDRDAPGVRVLVDPNALDPAGTTTLDGWSPSPDGGLLAYLLSAGGDEESRLHVLDVATGEGVDGPVDRLRYSSLAWLPDGRSLLYVRRLPPGQVPAGEEQFHRRVYLHRLGSDADADDVLVFGDGVPPTAYLGVTASPDGAWAAVTVNLGTAPRNDLHLARLPTEWPDRGRANLDWVAVAEGLDAQVWPHLDRRGVLWLLTDLGAPRRRLCTADPAAPGPDGWRTVVAEQPDAVLDDFALAGDRLVVAVSRHAAGEVTVHDRTTGAPVAAVGLPGIGSVDLTRRRDEVGDVWVGYSDFATPYAVWHLDPEEGTVTPRRATRPSSAAAPAPARAAVAATRVTARSADGTEVLVTVLSGAGRPDRPRPTVLYGYGGFGVPMTPAYSSTIRAWVEAGGVWAVANLRGGSEEGEAWHRAGMRADKQRVFEDFEAAADALAAAGWTTPAQLGIMGGSNGGLLVGAALTRSPDRYAAVVCSAPLLDMVRYEAFGLGATWNDEYGRADDPTELGWLLGYSPYHHVREGVAYPAVLFTVFDGDTRVDPLHARKMAAALQHATAADPAARPVLLRREADVGHGARAVRRALDLGADQLAFLGRQLGLTLP
ncbi:MAG TPA: prolyl oligopeptidase family serine peptidase [Acidimicrobiales bacterium]|nr:prolyl oligopeptidase family serine peptidase [Acidimicrobiales bacterium]